MRWLIVEDSLRNRKGHWLEYLATFRRDLPRLGDEAVILADRGGEPAVLAQVGATPALPQSIWHRMGDGAGPLRRYARVPLHACATWRAVARWQRRAPAPDVIFVPTVLVHHLLGWTMLIKRTLRRSRAQVILFFPNTPVQLDARSGAVDWTPAPTSKLFRALVRSLRAEAASGRVVLGAETLPMCAAMTRLTGVPFTYLPHPVTMPNRGGVRRGERADGTIVMGAFGAARHEKGSDVLFAAVEEFCRRYPDSRARFALQTVDAFNDGWRRLEREPKATLIRDYFPPGGYQEQLDRTDVLLLPYRRSSYVVRVSRVVIEAMVSGFPVVATADSTLSAQVQEFGSGTYCQDGDVESLVEAIRAMELNYPRHREFAASHRVQASEHFSVRHFRRLLPVVRTEEAAA